MDIPDDLLPDDRKSSGKRPISVAEKLNRLDTCLRAKVNPAENEQIADAMKILRAINIVRNNMTHGGSELIDALRHLGINYPIADYAKGWDHVRSRAAEALTMIRSSLETMS